MSRLLTGILGSLLLLLAGFGGIRVLVWLWPFPKGQGLTYAAHGIYLLAILGLSSLAFAILAWGRPERKFALWGACLLVAWAAILLVWSMR